MGDNGPGGNLIITNGANLTVNGWAATSYNDGGTMTVYDGATVNFNVHLFLGIHKATASGFTSEFIMKGGTVNIGDALLMQTWTITSKPPRILLLSPGQTLATAWLEHM